MFALNVESAACLDGHGYNAPEPPSVDVFVEQHQRLYTGADAYPWNPWEHAQDPEAIEVCPYPTGQDVYDYINESSTS